MNKKIYIIISILFCACNLFAKNFLIKDIIFYKDSAWQKVVYNYNDTKIVNTTTFISSDNIEWENYTYSTKQYKDGAVSEICDYTWNGNSWIMYRKELFEYSNKKLTLHSTTYDNIKEITTYEYKDNTTIQKQSFSQNDTLKNSITTIQKTDKNKICYIKTYSLSTQNDTLFSQITTFDYTPQQTTSTTYEKKDSLYLPTEKTITTTNKDKKTEIQYIYQHNDWIPVAKQTFYYNSSNNITKNLYQFWESNFWLSDYKHSYWYNDNETLSSDAISILQYKEWEITDQIYYNYNYNNQLNNASIEQTFWSETDREYNSYISLYGNNKPPFILCNNINIEYTDIPTNISINLSPINVYPNPSKSGIVFINTDLIIYNIAVYDTKGILRYQNNYNGHIDLSHLNNGIYIIQIDTEEGKFSFKQIINNY
jgi:hypothetical protein